MTDNNSPQIIDILMVVDAATIVDQYRAGTPSAPTSLPDDVIYLIVRNDLAVFGQGTGELKITARVEDVLRWRETSLSLNAAYSAILYKYQAVGGTAGVLDTPVPIVAEVETPLPVASDPLHPATQTIESYFWNAQAIATGEVTYTFSFMITDRKGNALGYYSWDPFIQVTE